MKFTSDLLTQSEKSNFGFIPKERHVAFKKYKQPGTPAELDTPAPAKGVSKRFLVNSFFGLCIIAAGFSVVYFIATKPSQSPIKPTESPIIDQLEDSENTSSLANEPAKRLEKVSEAPQRPGLASPETAAVQPISQDPIQIPTKVDVAIATNLKGENTLTTYLVVFQSLSSQVAAYARLQQIKPNYKKAYVQPAGSNFRIILDSITTFEPAMAISEQMKKKYGDIWITRK